MSLEVLAWVVIPVGIFLLGLVWGAVRMIVRMAQYFVRSEEAQKLTAANTENIATTLKSYMSKTDGRFDHIDQRFEDHGKQLAVLQWELAKGNGQPNVRAPNQPS